FSLGTQEATATTDLLGVAQTLLEVDQESGTKTLDVSFDEDDHNHASTSTASFDVMKENTTLEYLGKTLVQRNDSLELQAALGEIDAATGDLSNKTIEFVIGSGISTQTVTATTNASGIATVAETITVPAGVYQVNVSFSGDAYYLSSYPPASMLVVWEPTDDQSAMGGGEIQKTGVEKAKFGFNVEYDKALLLEGKFKYKEETEHDDGGHNEASGDEKNKLKFESTRLDWMIIADQVVMFGGKAKHKDLPEIHTFRVTAFDYGKPGAGVDEFILEIDGLIFASGTLTKGNIMIKN
ncbi:MAG: Ig-like domain repeat protein, partial [Actinomycetia bacterium]|nr:Ig-like domain repeat protein [Actinomycetes bacterium]